MTVYSVRKVPAKSLFLKNCCICLNLAKSISFDP
jgi:hypothetical protein